MSGLLSARRLLGSAAALLALAAVLLLLRTCGDGPAPASLPLAPPPDTTSQTPSSTDTLRPPSVSPLPKPARRTQPSADTSRVFTVSREPLLVAELPELASSYQGKVVAVTDGPTMTATLPYLSSDPNDISSDTARVLGVSEDPMMLATLPALSSSFDGQVKDFHVEPTLWAHLPTLTAKPPHQEPNQMVGQVMYVSRDTLMLARIPELSSTFDGKVLLSVPGPVMLATHPYVSSDSLDISPDTARVVGFSEDGAMAVTLPSLSSSYDGHVERLETEPLLVANLPELRGVLSEEARNEMEGKVWSFSPERLMVASLPELPSSFDGKIVLLVRGKVMLATHPYISSDSTDISPDSSRVLAVSEDGLIAVTLPGLANSYDGKVAQVFPDSTMLASLPEMTAEVPVEEGPPGRVLVYSPDSMLMATLPELASSYRGKVVLSVRGLVMAAIHPYVSSDSLDISPDTARVLGVSRDGMIAVTLPALASSFNGKVDELVEGPTLWASLSPLIAQLQSSESGEPGTVVAMHREPTLVATLPELPSSFKGKVLMSVKGRVMLATHPYISSDSLDISPDTARVLAVSDDGLIAATMPGISSSYEGKAERFEEEPFMVAEVPSLTVGAPVGALPTHTFVRAKALGPLLQASVPVPPNATRYTLEPSEEVRLLDALQGTVGAEDLDLALSAPRSKRAGVHRLVRATFYQDTAVVGTADVEAEIIPVHQIVLANPITTALPVSRHSETGARLLLRNMGNVDERVRFRVGNKSQIEIISDSMYRVPAHDSLWVQVGFRAKQDANSGQHGVLVMAAATKDTAQSVIAFQVPTVDMEGSGGHATRAELTLGHARLGDTGGTMGALHLRTQVRENGMLSFSTTQGMPMFSGLSNLLNLGPDYHLAYTSPSLKASAGWVYLPWTALMGPQPTGRGASVHWSNQTADLSWSAIRGSSLPDLPSSGEGGSGLRAGFKTPWGKLVTSAYTRGWESPELRGASVGFESKNVGPHRFSFETGLSDLGSVPGDTMQHRPALLADYALRLPRLGGHLRALRIQESLTESQVRHASVIAQAHVIPQEDWMALVRTQQDQRWHDRQGVMLSNLNSSLGLRYDGMGPTVSLYASAIQSEGFDSDRVTQFETRQFSLHSAWRRGDWGTHLMADWGQTGQDFNTPVRRLNFSGNWDSGLGWLSAGINGDFPDATSPLIRGHVSARLERRGWSLQGMLTSGLDSLTRRPAGHLSLEAPITSQHRLVMGTQISPDGQSRSLLIALRTVLPLPVTLPGASTRVKGRVYEDRNRNGRYDRGDRVLPGVVVRMAGASVVTDRSGQYPVLRKIASATTPEVDQSTIPADLVVAPRAGASNLDIALLPYGTIEVAVWDDVLPDQTRGADEGPSPSATVFLVSVDGTYERFRSSSSGNVNFSGVPVGSYRVETRKRSEEGKEIVYAEAEVQVTEGGVSQVKLAAPSTKKPLKFH